MDISIIVQVSVGMIVFYYILSLIVKTITSKIAEWAELKANIVENKIKELLTTVNGDASKMNKDEQDVMAKLDGIFNTPLMKNLEQDRGMINGWLNRSIHNTPTVPAATFALALFNVLVPNSQSKNFTDDFKTAIDNLPDGATQDALRSLTHASERKIDTVRKQVEQWFNDTMVGVSEMYKRKTRHIVWVVAALVVIILDADSIAVATRLWLDPALRDLTVGVAENIVSVNGELDWQTLMETLNKMNLPILWARSFDLWRLPGWLITWAAVILGAPFWYDMLKRATGKSSSSNKVS